MKIIGYLTTAVTTAVFLAGLTPSARAADDCQAKVSFDSVAPEGSNILATFRVKTGCAASTGRFSYTYESSAKPGRQVTRNSPTWNASDGKDFVLKDRLSGSGGAIISNVRVVKDSIESSKL
jgi:exopolysaccharide biosynthesis protein